MNLPNIVSELVHAQNTFDSPAYAACFSENAVVYDEGKTHTGRQEIERWIADANARYQATMQSLSFEEQGTESLLTAETSGQFPGSPIVLTYHLVIADGLIRSLKITG